MIGDFMKEHQLAIRLDSIYSMFKKLGFKENQIWITTEEDYIILFAMGDWIDITIVIEKNHDYLGVPKIYQGHWESLDIDFGYSQMFIDDDVAFVKENLYCF